MTSKWSIVNNQVIPSSSLFFQQQDLTGSPVVLTLYVWIEFSLIYRRTASVGADWNFVNMTEMVRGWNSGDWRIKFNTSPRLSIFRPDKWLFSIFLNLSWNQECLVEEQGFIKTRKKTYIRCISLICLVAILVSYRSHPLLFFTFLFFFLRRLEGSSSSLITSKMEEIDFDRVDFNKLRHFRSEFNLSNRENFYFKISFITVLRTIDLLQVRLENFCSINTFVRYL